MNGVIGKLSFTYVVLLVANIKNLLCGDVYIVPVKSVCMVLSLDAVDIRLLQFLVNC